LMINGGSERNRYLGEVYILDHYDLDLPNKWNRKPFKEAELKDFGNLLSVQEVAKKKEQKVRERLSKRR
jgi:hypothetical protein